MARPGPSSSLLLTASLIALLAGAGPAAEVGALGRIVPESGIITLAGPPGSTIEEVLVEAEQVVETGDPLVVFAGKPTLELELRMARAKRVDVGTSTNKAIEIQEATLAQLEASLAKAIEVRKLEESAAAQAAAYAKKVLGRLLQSEAASYSANLRSDKEHQAQAALISQKVARAETQRIRAELESKLELARLELERLRIQRDAALQEADLRVAMAEDALERVTLRAPSPGTVLDVWRSAGEASGGPLLHLADLREMAVRANIFQADLLKLRPGMKATIESHSLPRPLTGTLMTTGRMISEEGRVAPAVIRLDEPAIAARLLRLEVEVRLEGEPAAAPPAAARATRGPRAAPVTRPVTAPAGPTEATTPAP